MEFLTADVHAVTMMKLRLALPHLQRQALTQLVSPQDALAGLTCVTRFQTPTHYDRGRSSRSPLYWAQAHSLARIGSSRTHCNGSPLPR